MSHCMELVLLQKKKQFQVRYTVDVRKFANLPLVFTVKLVGSLATSFPFTSVATTTTWKVEVVPWVKPVICAVTFLLETSLDWISTLLMPSPLMMYLLCLIIFGKVMSTEVSSVLKTDKCVTSGAETQVRTQLFLSLRCLLRSCTGVEGGGAGDAIAPSKVLISWKSGQNL